MAIGGSANSRVFGVYVNGKVELVPVDDESEGNELSGELGDTPGERVSEDAHDAPSAERVQRILEHVHSSAARWLNVSTRTELHSVCAVPAHFQDAERALIKEASIAAGLPALRIVNQPTSAAAAHGLDRRSGETTFLVLDRTVSHASALVYTIDHGVFDFITRAREPVAPAVGGGEHDNAARATLIKRD